MTNDFNISLGGQIDVKSVNASIQSIENQINPIKLKVDLSDLRQQLQSITLNISQTVSSQQKSNKSQKQPSITLEDLGLQEDMLDKTISKANRLNQEYETTSTYIKDATTQVKVYSKVAKDSSAEIKKVVTTTNTGLKEEIRLRKQNDELIYKLQTSIRSYQNQGKLTAKQTQEFNSKLQAIGKSTQEVDKNKSLKELNEDIKEAANSTGLLGQSFSKAMVKYVTWLGIATIVAQLSRAIKSIISEVVELDKALTSLQMVTGYTDAEMDDLKNTLIDMSKELGVTVDALISGADEWMRAGLSASDAMEALRASTVMATVANMDNAEATQYLVAQMNAYGLAASDLMSLVDKMSAIDVVAATSTEELGEALSRTANSAQLAGVEYDKLLAMIATVSETTRQSANTIGNSFRSIFSRLQQVKLGSLVDEEGQDISNVDKLLKNYGINLMEVTNNLTDMESLLELLGSRWNAYTAAQKSEIATTIAGNYQRERFLVLMDNWDRVMELERVSLEANGSAMEKYSVYQDSVQAKINSLKAAWTELADATLNSGWISFLMEFAQGFLELSTNTGGLANSILGLASAFMVLKNVINAFKGGSFGISGILGIIGGAISGILAIINAVKNAQEEARRQALETAQANAQAAQEQTNEIEELRQEYINLASTIERTDETNSKLADLKKQLIDIYGEEAEALDLVNGKYEEQIAIIDDALIESSKDQVRALKAQLNIYEKDFKDFRKDIDDILKQTSWDYIPADINNLEQIYAELQESYEDPEAMLDVFLKWRDFYEEQDDLSKTEQKILDYINSQISELEPIVDNINSLTDQITDELTQQEYLDSPIRDMVVQFEKDLASINDMTEEQQRKMVQSIQSQLEAIRSSELFDTYKQFFEDIIADGEEWIENIKTQDYLLTELDKKLSALEKQKELNEEDLKTQEKLLAVEKAREELAKAKQQRIRVFRAGRGFVYEEDVEAVQEANEALQDAIQDASQTDLDKAIAAVEELQAMYNQAQLDQAAAGRTDLRDYFVDPDNVSDWLEMSLAQKKAFLDSFITTRDWNAPMTPESILNWVPTNAGGDKNFKGGATWVGEHGPELVNLPKGSEILSNQRSLRLTSLLNNPSNYLSGAKNGVILQFNGALNFPNVRDSSDANGFINALLQIGKNSIPNLT